MKHIFLGGVYPKEKEADLFEKSNGRLSFAANLHQWNMIKGLDENLKEPLILVNTYFVPAYPKFQDKKVKSYTWSHCENAEDENIGFLNLRGIKNFSQKHQIYKAVKKILDRDPKEEATVYIYTMRYCAMKAIQKLKKAGYHIHACLIVPDVPLLLSQYGQRKGVYNHISSTYNLNQIKKMTKVMDSFVLLSEPMTELIDIGHRPYCIVDGIYSYDDVSPECEQDENKNGTVKKIVYTGSLHKEYGICKLIEDFEKIKDTTYRLVIAGSGNAETFVKEATEKDSRISYVGTLPKDKVRELQYSATMLINPRQMNGIDSRYSFPSKTIEYLLCKKPVLMHRLPGMDKEYDNYLFTPEKYGFDSFQKLIEYVGAMPTEERNSIAEKGRVFILQNKSPRMQMEIVLEMVCKH